jgi:hypothetical protein
VDSTIRLTAMSLYWRTVSVCTNRAVSRVMVATGRGDGPASEALRRQPANLRHLARMSMMANDAYLFWTIAEGGGPVGTDMPAFKEALSTEEIWSVIQYLRRKL